MNERPYCCGRRADFLREREAIAHPGDGTETVITSSVWECLFCGARMARPEQYESRPAPTPVHLSNGHSKGRRR